MSDHGHHILSIEKLTFASMFTPVIEIVASFLVAFRNQSAGNFSTRADGALLGNYLTFTNCYFVGVWSDIDAVVSFVSYSY